MSLLLRGFTFGAQLSRSQPGASAHAHGTELMRMERALEIAAIAAHFGECKAEHPVCVVRRLRKIQAAELDL
jgi:hypothetical protein